MAKSLHESLKGVFEPREDGDLDLDKISNDQKVARAQQVRAMLQNPGWKVMNELVSILTTSLTNSIRTAKPEQIPYIQGQINGIEAWENSLSIVLDEGELAQQEIAAENDQAEAESESKTRIEGESPR